MQSLKRIVLAAAICSPFLAIGTAIGGEGVQVRITNDGTEDVVVTVYDMNTRPEKVVLENARVNGFTSVPINVVGDASGRANLTWTATSVDANSPQCGEADSIRVGNSSDVSVHADSSCST
jgi:hypothetical protein